jgi:H+/Cl- antiporter ClcA
LFGLRSDYNLGFVSPFRGRETKFNQFLVMLTVPGPAIVVIGMVAYFVGVVRAPLTGVIIVSEMTANRGLLLPLFLAAIIAGFAANWVCPERLYHGLANRFAERPPEPSGGPDQAAKKRT